MQEEGREIVKKDVTNEKLIRILCCYFLLNVTSLTNRRNIRLLRLLY